jgi:hypothetical protein
MLKAVSVGFNDFAWFTFALTACLVFANASATGKIIGVDCVTEAEAETCTYTASFSVAGKSYEVQKSEPAPRRFAMPPWCTIPRTPHRRTSPTPTPGSSCA